MPTPTYEPIFKAELTSNQHSLVFGTIPQNYTDLKIVGVWSRSIAGNLMLKPNSNLQALGSLVYVAGPPIGYGKPNNYRGMFVDYRGDTLLNHFEIDIFNYSNPNVFKNYSVLHGAGDRASEFYVGTYRMTDPIVSLEFYVLNAGFDGNMNAGSTFHVYGIKAEE